MSDCNVSHGSCNAMRSSPPKDCSECRLCTFSTCPPITSTTNDKSRCSLNKGKINAPTVCGDSENVVVDMDQPINSRTGIEHQQGYEDEINKNLKDVKDYEMCGDDYRIVNRRMDAGFSYRSMQESLKRILCEQNDTFQMNIGFGFVLYNPKDEEFKYFFDCRNHMLYEKPVTINHSEDLDRLVHEIQTFDLKEKYYLDLTPNMWMLAGFTNLHIRISFTNKSKTPISAPSSRRPSVRPILKRKNSGSVNHLNAGSVNHPKMLNPTINFLSVCIFSDNLGCSEDNMNLKQGLLQTCLVR